MKNIFLIFLIIVFLFSCESQSDKSSRITISKFTRKLNSIIVDVINNRENEGSQTKVNLE